MIRGGYKIIDLKNKELQEGVGMLYEGIYDSIEECLKPILVSGLNIDGIEYKDFWATVLVVDRTYEIDLAPVIGNSYKLVISDTDVVTVTEF